MKKLRIGDYELIPINRIFSSFREFLDWSNSLSDGSERSRYKLTRYLFSLKKIGILKYILDNYSVTFITDISLEIDKGFGYKNLIIEDPLSVENFLNGEDAIAYDDMAKEYEVNKDDILDYQEQTGTFFIVKKI
jgi:hypothetical protein